MKSAFVIHRLRRDGAADQYLLPPFHSGIGFAPADVDTSCLGTSASQRKQAAELEERAQQMGRASIVAECRGLTWLLTVVSRLEHNNLMPWEPPPQGDGVPEPWVHHNRGLPSRVVIGAQETAHEAQWTLLEWRLLLFGLQLEMGEVEKEQEHESHLLPPLFPGLAEGYFEDGGRVLLELYGRGEEGCPRLLTERWWMQPTGLRTPALAPAWEATGSGLLDESVAVCYGGDMEPITRCVQSAATTSTASVQTDDAVIRPWPRRRTGRVRRAANLLRVNRGLQ